MCAKKMIGRKMPRSEHVTRSQKSKTGTFDHEGKRGYIGECKKKNKKSTKT